MPPTRQGTMLIMLVYAHAHWALWRMPLGHDCACLVLLQAILLWYCSSAIGFSTLCLINARRACARGLQYCLSVVCYQSPAFFSRSYEQNIPTCLFFARFSMFSTIRIRWNGFFREIEHFTRLFCSFQSRRTVPYTTCGYVECHARSTISANSANSIGHEWGCRSAGVRPTRLAG